MPETSGPDNQKQAVYRNFQYTSWSNRIIILSVGIVLIAGVTVGIILKDHKTPVSRSATTPQSLVIPRQSAATVAADSEALSGFGTVTTLTPSTMTINVSGGSVTQYKIAAATAYYNGSGYQKGSASGVSVGQLVRFSYNSSNKILLTVWYNYAS